MLFLRVEARYTYYILLITAKKTFSPSLCMNSNSHLNHGEAVYIIIAKAFIYTRKCVMIYSPDGLMRYNDSVASLMIYHCFRNG